METLNGLGHLKLYGSASDGQGAGLQPAVVALLRHKLAALFGRPRDLPPALQNALTKVSDRLDQPQRP